jgi:peptidyl-prolyl cis-trans isomerase B (cyclophilin B)
MHRALALLASLLVAASAAACGSDEEDKKEPGKRGQATTRERDRGNATTAAPGGAPQAECRRVPRPRPKGRQRIRKPDLELETDKTYRAIVDTSCGRFTITLDVERAPRTAASFVYLARRGFYDNLTFHRIVPGFVIQGGDPLGNGQGGPGYSVVESPPRDVRYTRGTVAMAKTEVEEPGTSGSQFYVVTATDAQLPADYAVLGQVSGGQEVVRRIGVVPTDQTNRDPALRDRPLQAVVIRTITITESQK